ncbi:MAG: hypothetical protein CVU81_02915 [Euryarchaeota archaeon HGW-Euryarchaeota-1]|nr:MAG: hypothetical protein CVU81_02915 [Euryarchaeota archaeon HGW-Euryarchaeota-1]
MRIAFFTDTYFPQVNGVTFAVNQFKKAIERSKSHNITLFYPTSNYKPAQNEIPLFSLPFPFYKGFRVIFPWQRISSETFDIVHTHGLYGAALLGLKVAKKLKIPCVATYHTPTYLYTDYLLSWLPLFIKKPANKLLRAICWWWEKRILKQCDLVLAPSEVIVEFLRARGIKNAVELSNGIDLTQFKSKRKKLSRKTIGYVGRLGFEKHVEDLINIAKQFDGDILIVGDGPARQYYEKLAKGKPNIKFLGNVAREKLNDIYNSLDFLVNSSTVETQSLTAIEAMACGTPVIGAAALALEKTITHGITGFLYEPGNYEDLFKKLQIAYQNKDFLSKNCINKAKTQDIKQTTNKLLQLYLDLKKRAKNTPF